jgi:oligoribonuclease
MAKKEAIVNRFVWIDCEMTGLDIAKDVLLEIATIITDVDLNIIAEGPDIVIHQPDDALDNMIPVVKDLHSKSGLTDEVKKSTVSLAQAEQKTLSFIHQYCQRDQAVLAGNSVWQDGIFLRKYMPKITEYLNYRIVDVSSVKVLVRQWYPHDHHVKFKKAETHRALNDIKESIAELKWYKKHFFTLGG